MTATGRTFLSAGIACADCGIWPMPDPFFALVDEAGNIDRYVCTDCGKQYPPEPADAELDDLMAKFERVAVLIDSHGGCDHSLRHSLSVFGPEAIPSFKTRGGHCDCEVLMNVAAAAFEPVT